MGSDLTTMAWIYMRKYMQPAVDNIVERDHPRFARITKKSGFGGESVTYPILTGNPQGVGGVFATAQSAASSSKGEKLVVTRRPKFGVIQLDAEAIAASEGSDSAFYDLVTRETTGKLQQMGEDFAFDAYRGGNGQRGRRASASGNIITLSVADDARNFFRGMTVIADDTSTGASPRSGSTTVTSVNIPGGTITLASAAAISSFADNDYLFRAGDPGTCMDGLEVLTPLTAPSPSESFRGIDRSVDVARLSGSRVADDGSSLEERIGLGGIYVAQVGKVHAAKYVWANPINFWEVVKRQNAKVMHGNPGAQGYRATYGFEYIDIATPAGVMQMFSDPDCPTTLVYGENMAHTYILHLKGLPHIAMDGNKPSIVQYNAAGLEARAYSWCNQVQEDPAGTFVVEV